MTTRETILVVGGTGKTGRRVAQKLRTHGQSVRPVARSTTPRFDWEDERTWGDVLRDVGAMYLSYAPDLAVPGAAQHIAAFVRRAAAEGVRRVVLLSGRGEPQVLPAEAAVREHAPEWTILRAAFFAQNFSEGLLEGDVRAGTIAFPAGTVAEPFVDVEDLADVAVAALGDGRHAGEIYDCTGPRLLTFAEAAAEIAEAAGRPVRYQAISGDDYAAVLSQVVPPEVAGFLRDLFAYVLDGHNATLGDGVPRALGRPARDFRAFARAVSW